ncbi:uncharacterized protein LOC123682830 isoform X2 [Harmonia axyridis]|uniref:uncharacterized protein LOC123682830 isoform X2 n=1 Tax=Harmonia axyridis TaxID=115357 RepID=UPI001E277428|nr:uncharacterized protein LOC123682830 isoform X2 [Harmonia axyridis]
MNLKVQIFLICSVSCALSFDLKQRKRQISQGTNTEIEPEPSATGFQEAAAVQAGSKYFQYIHAPSKDHVEHGHRRGTDHHFIERHEKAKPHDGEFKTKVRWGDKHGGYGEHYWDYNHAGHDGHDGEESSHNEQYAAYEEEGESVPVPTYADNSRGKREQLNQDVEFISPKARSLVLSGVSGKHGGNYMSEKDFERRKREQKKRKIKSLNGDYLLYQPETGRVVDHKTGITYELKPVEF